VKAETKPKHARPGNRVTRASGKAGERGRLYVHATHGEKEAEEDSEGLTTKAIARRRKQSKSSGNVTRGAVVTTPT